MTQQPERALEMGAPARLVDDEAGVDEVQTVIGMEIDLAQRERVVATLGAIPDESTDEVAELAKREDERQEIIPAADVPLNGPGSAALDSWQYPPVPEFVDGEKILGLNGSQIEDDSLGPEKFIPESVDGDKIEPGSIEKKHLSQELLNYISEQGGSQEIIGYPDLDPGMQALFCKIESLPPPENVLAADPDEGQLTPPIWDPQFHRPIVEGTEGGVRGALAPHADWPEDVDLETPKWMFGFRDVNGVYDHYDMWTFTPPDPETGEPGKATFDNPDETDALTMVEIVLPTKVFKALPTFAQGRLISPVWWRSHNLFIPISISYRILEIKNPHRRENIGLFRPMGYGVSWRRFGDTISIYDPPVIWIHTMGRGVVGKFHDIVPLTGSSTRYAVGTGSKDEILGYYFGIRLQIQAQKVTITDPEVRFASISIDPSYRGWGNIIDSSDSWSPEVCK